MRIRTDDVAWQEIDGELVVLDLRTSAYLTTNRAGAVLAQRLREEQSLEALAAALVDEFDIDRATAVADAEAFVDSLRELSLLTE
ncbi:PqqD family protein [Isoptericola aurantiacus]|uniref:PqqD family protein n=1 Tax=Isoptericola aurantiacus TaxID=3377839 RepID=UPI00383B6445